MITIIRKICSKHRSANRQNNSYLFYMLLSIIVFISSIDAGEKKGYLSKTLIDTMVHNAYYKFISAAEIAGSAHTQRNAILYAKRVANKLKKFAKGDPNWRYILWKVGELENQIHLEEEELSLKEMYKRQKEINALVGKFNAEIGKWRPNFMNLVAIQARMEELEIKKGNELLRLINTRSRNICREVAYFIDEALKKRNYDKAEKEFNFLRDNRKYLNISFDRYSRFEEKIRAKHVAEELAENIDQYIGEICEIVRKGNISKAFVFIKCLKNRVNGVGSLLSYHKRKAFNEKIDRLSRKLIQKEDSLVSENMRLIRIRDIDAAVDYLENVLKSYNVSNDKILKVDRAIMAAPGRRNTYVDNAVNREINNFENYSTENNGLLYDDIQERVRIKADSIREFNEEQNKVEFQRRYGREIEQARKMSAKIYSLLKKNKIEKAYGYYKRNTDLLKAYLNSSEYNKLKDSCNARKANKLREDIYSLLQRNNAKEAYDKFNKNRYPLEKHSSTTEFFQLKREVEQAYEVYESEELARRNEPAETYETEPQTYNTYKVENQSTYNYEETETQVANDLDPYAAFDRKREEAKKVAREDVIKIYNLIEQDRIESAHKLFREQQIPIRKYTCKEAYAVLEATVLKAYNSKKY